MRTTYKTWIENMKFEFGKYTEITDFALATNPEYKNNGYTRIFICPDVNDFWLVKILEGYNEEYEKETGSFLLEREKIAKYGKTEKLSIPRLKSILEEDDFCNWDYKHSKHIGELIEIIDGGFGILNLKENA